MPKKTVAKAAKKVKETVNVPSVVTLHHNEKLFAALSYLWVMSVIFLVLNRHSDFVQFHAKQGLALWLLSIVCWFLPPLGWLLNLAIMVLILIGFLEALEGNRWKLPFIGNFAARLHL